VTEGFALRVRLGDQICEIEETDPIGQAIAGQNTVGVEQQQAAEAIGHCGSGTAIIAMPTTSSPKLGRDGHDDQARQPPA